MLLRAFKYVKNIVENNNKQFSFYLTALNEHFRYLLFGTKLSDPYKIPIIINNYNRYEMLCKLINSLVQRGYYNIYILDNKSTYPPLLEYYQRCPHKVIKLDKNYGFQALWLNKSIFQQFKNNYYVYTDADMEIDPQCPNNFIEFFISILKKYPLSQKVGFGIRIDDLPNCYANKDKVIEWEKQFWKKELSPGLYKAWIDTTFALYRPFAYGPTSERLTIRTGSPYLIKHLPWYIDSENLTDEELYYIKHISKSTHWSQLNK